MNSEPFELELHDFKEMAMETLNERDHFEICAVVHANSRLAAVVRMLGLVCKFIVSNFTIGLGKQAIYPREIELFRAPVDKKLVKICRCCAKRGRYRRHPRSLLCKAKVLEHHRGGKPRPVVAIGRRRRDRS